MLENIEPGIIIAIIGALAAIMVAWWRTRSEDRQAEGEAERKEEVSALSLAREYGKELERMRLELSDVKAELARLQDIVKTNYGTLKKEYELLIDELKREIRVITEKYTKLLQENAALRERVRELEIKYGTGPLKEK